MARGLERARLESSVAARRDTVVNIILMDRGEIVYKWLRQ